MWMVSYGVLGLNMACMGSIFVTLPFLITKPAGVFIHAFVLTINQADANPLIQIGNEQSQCARGVSLSQPYRYRPRKMASRKNAKPSKAKAGPTTEPANLIQVGQSRPSSNERMIPDTAPIANRMADARAQRRVKAIHSGSLRRSASPSAIHINNGNPTPNEAKII